LAWLDHSQSHHEKAKAHYRQALEANNYVHGPEYLRTLKCINKPGILARAQMPRMIDPTGEHKVLNRATSKFEPREQTVSGV
jgi:hypothetical protein